MSNEPNLLLSGFIEDIDEAHEKEKEWSYKELCEQWEEIVVTTDIVDVIG